MGGRRWVTVAAFAMVAVAVLLDVIIDSSPARDGLLRVHQISPGDLPAQGPTLAVDGAGDAIAAWSEPGQSASVVIGTAFSAAGAGHWTDPPGPASMAFAEQGSVVLAAAPGGAAVEAWTDALPGKVGPLIEARVRPGPERPWGHAHTVAYPSGRSSPYPLAGIDTAGRIVLAWTEADGSVHVATGSARTGRWRPARTLRAPRSTGSPFDGTGLQLAVTPAGRALLLWQHRVRRELHRRTQPTDTSAIEVASGTTAGEWAPPVRAGTSVEPEPMLGSEVFAPQPPRLALTPAGAATVLFQTGYGTGQRLLAVTRSDRTRRFGRPVTLASGALSPALAADGAGDLTAVWNDRAGRTETATRSATGGWSRTVTIPGPRCAVPWLSTDARGDALITCDGAHDRVLARERRGARGRWRPPRVVGQGAVAVSALDQAGAATVVWLGTTDHVATVKAVSHAF